MTINERFIELIKVLYGGNNAAFAKAIAVAPTVIQNVVGTRQGKPSFEVVAKVCALANVNTEWVISGNGEMLLDSTPIQHSEASNATVIDKLVETIQNQAKEIGRLEAELAETKKHAERLAGLVNTDESARVG